MGGGGGSSWKDPRGGFTLARLLNENLESKITTSLFDMTKVFLHIYEYKIKIYIFLTFVAT